MLSIDTIENLMIDVYDGILTYTYTCDIANESLDCDMTLRYWVIYE